MTAKQERWDTILEHLSKAKEMLFEEAEGNDSPFPEDVWICVHLASHTADTVCHYMEDNNDIFEFETEETNDNSNTPQ